MCPGFHRTAVIFVRAFTVLLLYVSGLSPYCCYICTGLHHTAVMCPGLHRTAVICVRAFTVLLLYSYLNYTQTGLHMELSNYPPNTITKYFYVKSNNTIYSLINAYIRLSQDRSVVSTRCDCSSIIVS